jgi:hypothetical protein
MLHRLRASFIISTIVFSFLLTPIVQAQDQNRGVDVVLIFDTSGPLLNQLDRLCPAMLKDLAALTQRGFDLKITPLGITSPYGCATDSVKNSIANSTVASNGDWGAAIVDVATHFAWRSNALRIIIPISNRGPALGDPVDDPGLDRDSIGRAIKSAQANHVAVSLLIGAPDRATQPIDHSKLLVLAADLAKGTGGQVIELSDLVVDPTHSVFELIDRAARTATNGPLLSIPAAVRTLTCQRDSIKCLSLDLSTLITNAGLAIWFTLILGFATALLNTSLTKIHPPKMEGRLINGLSNSAQKINRGAHAVFAPETLTVGSASLRRGVSIVLLIIFVGLTALFASFIDPEFNPASARGVGIFLMLFFAIGLISLVYAQTQIRSARAQTLTAALRIRPLNLLIILIAALLSRAIGFLPGFLIGLPASYVLLAEPPDDDKQQVRIVSSGLIVVLIIAAFAWLLATPIDLALGSALAQNAEATASLGVNLLGALQSVVLTIYVVAIELAFVALFPWTLTSGHRLYARNKLIWGVLFGIVSFAALETIFNPTLSGFDVFQNSALLIIGGLLAIVTGIALSVWLSVNQKQASGEEKVEQRSLLNLLIVIAAWLVVCGCGAAAFITRSVNWGNVLLIAALLVIIAGGGFFALRVRAARMKDQSDKPKDAA